MALPRALAPFLAFPRALREAGFAAAPEQTQGFIAAVGLLGPRSLRDVRLAAHAVFGPSPDQRVAFDEVFDRVFLGRGIAAPMPGEAEDLPAAFDDGGFDLLPEAEETEEAGAEATTAERLSRRDFDQAQEEEAARRLRRRAPSLLPRRRSRRLTPGAGRLADPRRAFRDMLRRDGELTALPTRRRRLRQRRVLLLIDVSGSMKAATAGTLRLAHALVQAGERVEAFTLGTRLTRITRALAHRDPAAALSRASGLVADWDGGTRLGEALAVFLSVPRFAAFARGALVIIVSDGLERGGPEALVSAMSRLRGLAWGLLWLTPLAADPAYRPETGAMRAILPLLDRLGDGGSAAAIADEVLGFGAAGPAR
ncbi:MAG: VWA domain-containing protein [Acetobacteraceae bacterium]|jgi:hypothetical protein|nr:VWA domain-containing protein [Acetobacteraceae bacterium]